MDRKQLRTAALVAGVAIVAMGVFGSSSFAKAKAAPSRYVLRHPKREHCKAHYVKRRVLVKKRVHGHIRKVRVTMCVRVRHAAPMQGTAAFPPAFAFPTYFPGSGAETTPVGSWAPRRKTREPPPSQCTSTFTGAAGSGWETSTNWTAGVPSGSSAYACIPGAYTGTVVFGAGEDSLLLGGVSANNAGGITLAHGQITLTNPSLTSFIENVKPGGTTVTLNQGVTLELGGETGELGGDVWNGPGTLEIPRGAIVRTGTCAKWSGKNESICEEGALTPGRDGLQVRNFGTIFGAGISLCRDSASQPARFENQGFIHLKNSGGFDGEGKCSEPGTVVNGVKGTLGIAQLDGSGCNIDVKVASLVNDGFVKVAACYPESIQHHALLEIGSSFTNAGIVDNRANIQIDGNFTPTSASDLTVNVADTLPPGEPERNFGTIKVAGDATLAGELTFEDAYAQPKLGETYQILETGGSLSGEFVLGNRCIPSEPGVGYNVNYKFGSEGSVTLEAAKVAGC
jgi:hypothetical protein